MYLQLFKPIQTIRNWFPRHQCQDQPSTHQKKIDRRQNLNHTTTTTCVRVPHLMLPVSSIRARPWAVSRCRGRCSILGFLIIIPASSPLSVCPIHLCQDYTTKYVIIVFNLMCRFRFHFLSTIYKF